MHIILIQSNLCIKIALRTLKMVLIDGWLYYKDFLKNNNSWQNLFKEVTIYRQINARSKLMVFSSDSTVVWFNYRWCVHTFFWRAQYIQLTHNLPEPVPPQTGTVPSSEVWPENTT